MKQHIVRGMDHVGITVPDIEEATAFFCAAFGAELIYESVAPTDNDIDNAGQEKILHLAPGTRINAVRMLRLHHGPGIELFEMKGPDQREPQRSSDFGLQHFALYTDDIEQAIVCFQQAGGTMFTDPQPLKFASERGDGNVFCYGRTPWGSIIEFISLPSPLPYEKYSTLRRWQP